MLSFFKSRKRAFILIYIDNDGVRLVIDHPDDTKFSLEKRENAQTAARFILRDFFPNIHQEVDIHRSKSFEHDDVEYQIIKFDGPVIPNPDGSDGIEKMRKAGYTISLLGDHPLSPRIKKALES